MTSSACTAPVVDPTTFCAAYTVTLTWLVPAGVIYGVVDVEEHAVRLRSELPINRNTPASDSSWAKRSCPAFLNRLRNNSINKPLNPALHHTNELAVGVSGGTFVLMTKFTVVGSSVALGVLAVTRGAPGNGAHAAYAGRPEQLKFSTPDQPP